MIRVKYNGTLGNNMWQYAVARLYAENHGHSLCANSIEMFPNTLECVDGCGVVGNSNTHTGHIFDFGVCSGDVLFDGHFQRYSYLKGQKSKIQRWFAPVNNIELTPSVDDLVMTIRRGWNGYPISMCPPIEFYLNLLESFSFDKVYLCTDSFDDDYFNPLKKHHNIVFYDKSKEEQFCLLMNSTNIVISPSTFSWWGAYLSNATRIFYPWIGDLIPSRDGPDVFVDDEPRYIKVYT